MQVVDDVVAFPLENPILRLFNYNQEVTRNSSWHLVALAGHAQLHAFSYPSWDIDGDDFFIDLVFFNRLLKCFVIVEIKTEKLTHQDIGQLQMYVNYYDRVERIPTENPTIGILLCAQKNNSVVKFSLPESNKNIIASQYQLYLPTEKQLLEEVKKELRNFEEE